MTGDVTSPSVSLESVLITENIEAYEGSDVAVINMRGGFMSADMDDEVIMMLRVRLTELMVNLKYITLDANNKPVTYVKLQKALYGCLMSALLFYL
jgi:hypothetical protein